MLSFQIVPAKNTSDKLLSTIISIKQIHWPYSKTQQIEWIEKNLMPNDKHALLIRNNVLVAYLNLIEINLQMGSIQKRGLGLGNVCVSKKGIGLGDSLMTRTNEYLIEENTTGLLFWVVQIM